MFSLGQSVCLVSGREQVDYSHMGKRQIHESLRRLLQAAATQGVVGPAALARSLGTSDQVVTNWGKRGVSQRGAIQAQRRYLVAAQWIISGVGEAQIKHAAAGEREIEALSNDARHLARLFDDVVKGQTPTEAGLIYQAAHDALMREARRIRSERAGQIESATPTDAPARPRPSKTPRGAAAAAQRKGSI